MNAISKYKIGDIIEWYCDMEQCVHKGEIIFVNYACVGYPDINYEVETFCCGEMKTHFVDEDDVLSFNFN